jgi:hypothetical protein
MFNRRRLKISVRVLMLLIIVVGVVLAWRANTARRQHEAVAAIRRCDGWAHYDYEFVPGPSPLAQSDPKLAPRWGTLTPGRTPPAPAWLRRIVGDEYFQEIAHVSFLYDLDNRMLVASMLERPSGDDILAKLEGQTGIKTLHFGYEKVTARGLASIAQLPALEELIVCNTDGISDADLARLEGLKKLKLLLIGNSWLTDEALRHVGRLRNLEDLSLDGQCGSDSGLEYLRRLTRLKSLKLGMTAAGISDAGIDALALLTDLETLDLDGCRGVTDRGLERLHQLTKLTNVRLRGSRITPAGRERFMAVMPTLIRLD